MRGKSSDTVRAKTLQENLCFEANEVAKKQTEKQRDRQTADKTQPL